MRTLTRNPGVLIATLPPRSGSIVWNPTAAAWHYYPAAGALAGTLTDSCDDLAELRARWPLAEVHVRAADQAPNVDQGLHESSLRDDRGRVLAVGDSVFVLYVDRDRGAERWMGHGTVVALRRTRALVKFPGRNDPYAVGAEVLRVTP